MIACKIRYSLQANLSLYGRHETVRIDIDAKGMYNDTQQPVKKGSTK